ncbi:MAG: YqzL family protein [Bacillota bacterium]
MIWTADILWRIFELTGSVSIYLLYKEFLLK